MAKVLDILRSDGLNCVPTLRYDIDENNVDDDMSSAGVGEAPFEYPYPKTNKISVLPPWPTEAPSPFRYFIDGSRRAFRVADIVIKNRYYPIVAGQVGVAVIERQHRKLKPVQGLSCFERYIVFPGKLPASDLNEIQSAINEKSKFGFFIEKYDVKDRPNLADLGVAKLNTIMQLRELEAIGKLSDNGRLSDSEMLVIDGTIQFARKEFRIEDFRYVVGVAKSFSPTLLIGKGKKRKDVGTLVKNLEFGERSQVHQVDLKGKYKIGSWYLRVHQKMHVRDPLHGVVKVEVFAKDQNEFENGLDSERVDTLSKVLLSERYPSPYGKDARWHVHLYPIFQAEQYIKSRFTSSATLKGAF